MSSASMDTLLAKLSEQQILLEKQKNALTPADEEGLQAQISDSSSSSAVLTPVSDSFHNSPSADGANDDDTIKLSAAEMARLKKELVAAKDQIARQKHELEKTRGNTDTKALDKTNAPSSQHELYTRHDIGERSSAIGQHNFNAVSRPVGTRVEQWPINEDARSDSSDTMSGIISGGVLNSHQHMWPTSTRSTFNANVPAPVNQQLQPPGLTWGQPGARPWGNRATLAPLTIPQQPQAHQRVFSGPTSPVSTTEVPFFPNTYWPNGPPRFGRTQTGRSSSNHQPNRNNGWDTFAGGISPVDNVNLGTNSTTAFQSMGLYPAAAQYQPRPIGTPLSPTAEEFRTTQPSATPWNAAVGAGSLPC